VRYITIFFYLTVLTLSIFLQPAAAETRYVDDQLIITLRMGKSSQHKILKTLKTGTPLEILNEEDETYLKVRTQDGTEGYVLRQYVSSNPPKSQRIAELERLNSSLQKKISSLEAANSNLKTQINSYQENYQQEVSSISVKSAELEKNLEQAMINERIMAEKYDTLLAQSENVVEITAERDLLSEKSKKLQADVAVLSEKNEKLSDARMVKWFLAGGGVFFFGWIIGKISRKKRSRL
jgi:SH3 domain protein